MLPHFSQYSPFGLLPPSPGMQGFGGIPGVGQSPGFGGAGAYGQGYYGQNGYGPFAAVSPFAMSPFAMSQYPHHQESNSLYTQPGYAQPGVFGAQPGGAFATAPQIIPLIAHLAQQIHLQSGVTQQIGVALSHLVQHLAVLGPQAVLGQPLQGGAGLGFGAGQPFGFNPFVGAAGLGGQTPPWAAQPWAAQRSQTIQ
jgi:hypothetical protein